MFVKVISSTAVSFLLHI